MLCPSNRHRARRNRRTSLMILADKITALRKKAGWSQEELAEQLGVTRQSVSKWEGAQSVPDMDKVVQMSRLFGVTTDFLLKDELSEEEPAPEGCDSPLRRVTMAEASEYLALRCAALRASPPPTSSTSARSAASTGCSSPPFTSSTPSAPWATGSRNTAGSSGRSRACSSARSCWW